MEEIGKKLAHAYGRWLLGMVAIGMAYPAFALVSSLPLPRWLLFVFGLAGLLGYTYYRYQSFEGASPEIQRRLTFRDKRLWLMAFVLFVFGFAI